MSKFKSSVDARLRMAGSLAGGAAVVVLVELLTVLLVLVPFVETVQ